MKKRILFFICISLLLVSTFGIVSAEEGCCETLKNGAWCQRTTQDQCETTIAPTSCDSYTPCTLGTCIDENKGSCMPNTPKNLCEAEGGLWNDLPKDEISVCQNGCCLFGEYASFTTQTECKQLATVYSVDVNFRQDVTDEFTCYDMASLGTLGACVSDENQTTRDCAFTTKEACLASGKEFYENFLCTAPELATNCAKTGNTICKDDKVYFIDSCGNLANVYDESMYSKNPNEWNAQIQDYWTKVQEPSCTLNPGSSACGDCSYVDGTICREHRAGKKGMPNKPEYGDNVCAELSCYYDTDGDGEEETYQHGESWCAQSKGVYPGINVTNQTSAFREPNFEKKNSNTNKYNLPGSRFYRLMCMDGEVIIEPCKDFRNEVCVQSDMGLEAEEFKVAQCWVNTWRDCFSYLDEPLCEKSIFCDWVPGYRFDGQIVTTDKDRNQDEQGSCVPAFAPGFDFWGSESTGNVSEEEISGGSICSSLGNVQETASFETHIFIKRDNFMDNPTCDLNSNNDAVQRCFQGGCYAIPGYGLISPEEDYFGFGDGNYIDLDTLFKVHTGQGGLSSTFENYCISDREGYYCPEKTGEVKGNEAKCADTKAGQLPIFLTHEEWIESISTRARALGDCGYKPGTFVSIKEISKELEIVTVLFQKLGQKGQLKGNNSVERIYEGNFEYVAKLNGSDYR